MNITGRVNIRFVPFLTLIPSAFMCCSKHWLFLFLHTSDAVQVCVCRMRSLFHLFPPHFSCLSCLSCFSCLFFFILSSCDSKSFFSQEAFIKDLRFIFNDQSPMIWYCNALDKSPTLERLWIWLSLSFSDKLLMTIS